MNLDKFQKTLITDAEDNLKHGICVSNLTYLIATEMGLSDEVKETIAATLKECGFDNVEWVLAHGVITTHGGPAAFGIAGFEK